MSPPDLASDPKVKELTASTQSLVAKARTIKIATADEYSGAAIELQTVKGARERLESLRKSFTQPLDQAKKAIMDFFRAPTEQLDETERLYKRAMIGFSDEQERIRREEQARADEAARKERERIEAQAAKAAESGKVEKADALQQRAAAVVAPVIQREAPKVAGIETRKIYRFEVTDPAKVPREYLSVDEKKIGGVVRALKLQTNIPGVRVWEDKNIAAGAA